MRTGSVSPGIYVLTPLPSFRLDALVYALILALCAVPFFMYERAPDFVNEDVYYVDLANSLLHQHIYVANFARERVQPPGLPIILAGFCATVGCTHDILTQSMSVFLAFGLFLSYAVIRRQRGRLFAATSCLLIAASPTVFPWVTTRLWPTFPYFAISMLILLLIPKIEIVAAARWLTILGISILAFLLSAAVIIESAGIALIAAISAWLVLSYFLDPRTAKLRLKRFLPIVSIAFAAEAVWLQQGSNVRDWPLPGRGESYIAQLRLKDGNAPEMGFASPRDIVLRVEKNLRESIGFLDDTILHRWISPSWTSPLRAGALILIVCGLLNSLAREDGRLCALYFIFYEFIYLLWPWFSGVIRFAMAVLPLACMFLFEGIIALREWSRRYPQRIATLFLPISLILAFFASRHASNQGLQDKISVVFWLVSGIFCLGLLRKAVFASRFSRRKWQTLVSRSFSLTGLGFGPGQFIAVLAAACLIFEGVTMDISMGRQNFVSGVNAFQNAPEIRAARWIKLHTDPNVVVTSRQTGLLYHYSRRKVVWFPPITDPRILLKGFRDHDIEYVVIVIRKFSYYRPSEADCFDLLDKEYPENFHLVEKSGNMRIYQVLATFTDAVSQPHNSLSGETTPESVEINSSHASKLTYATTKQRPPKKVL